jgi:hypothetical protein
MSAEQLAAMDVEGFGVSSFAELAELRKALDFSYTSAQGVGFNAMRVESLDATLRLMTFQQTNLRLWNQIPKQDAYSTVEEFNRLLEYGQDGGAFTQSGELPQEEDSIYERASEKVKFLGTTRSVTHPASLIRTLPADVIAQETQNGALWLMGKLNSALYYGDSDAIPVEFNGLPKQIELNGGTVIDKAGAPLTTTDIEGAAQTIGENFGTGSQFFSNNKVFSEFSLTFNQYQRFVAPGTQPGLVGTPVTGVTTTLGPVMFQPDMFVKEGKVAGTSATSLKAPTTPTLVVANAGATTGSAFVAGDAGTYQYQVSAMNQYGESVPTPLSSGVVVAAGDGVTLTIADNGGTIQASAYKIYRTDKNGLVAYSIRKLEPRAKVNGVYVNTTTFTDLNLERPRTFLGLMLDLTPNAVNFRQLSPMIKMNLAIISPAIRWMQLLYGTPIVYAPKRHVLFKNIGHS